MHDDEAQTKTREVVFRGWRAKADYLDGAAWDDARRPAVRDMARRLVSSIDPNAWDARIDRLYEFVRRVVRYMPDPSSEEFSDAEEILRQGYGDCDDKVRLFVALVRSVSSRGGAEAVVRPVLVETADGEPDFAHVQALVRWPGSYRHPKAGRGGWLVAELILRDARLGDDASDVPSRVLA